MCSVAGTAFFEGTVHSAFDAEGKDERECRPEICIAHSECASISNCCNPHRVVTLASHNKMHQSTSHSKSNYYKIGGLRPYSSLTPHVHTAPHFCNFPRLHTCLHSISRHHTCARSENAAAHGSGHNRTVSSRVTLSTKKNRSTLRTEPKALTKPSKPHEIIAE
jgi:hypothetical protein